MTEVYTLKSGKEAPLGASVDPEGCNFALWAPDATQVWLCLFDAQERSAQCRGLQDHLCAVWILLTAVHSTGQVPEVSPWKVS